MLNVVSYLDGLLFGILPYVAMFTFLLVTIQRYRGKAFTYSSLSSQFLENRQHFFGLVPFHYGILAVLAGHVAAFLMPASILLWNRQPMRLYLLEITGLAFGVLTVVGLVLTAVRRWNSGLVRAVTTKADVVVLALLFVQVVSGLYTAIAYPWGSSWFALIATPYLWSLVRLSPDLAAVGVFPLVVKLHIVNTFLLILVFPFTRLVHMLVVPNPYLWRRPQVVRWYRKPAPNGAVSVRAVYALYPDGQSAQEAVDGLRAAGVVDRDITIMSGQPMEDFEFGQRDKRTWMWWIACGGGVAGLSVGTWLTRMAQQAWPLVTGGMPITPWWSNLIIMFELTMLGAIVATVITLLVTAGLPARQSKLLYDPEVTNGRILVGVEHPAERSISGLEHVLGAPRGALVKIV